MNLGVVGPEQAKFTPETERLCRDAIRRAIKRHGATTIVSGHCHLGGVDIFAEEIAKDLGLQTLIFEPKQQSWFGSYGYRARNLDIAKNSDLVFVPALRVLPPSYNSQWRFEKCYHCRDQNPPHVKSGGCWTAWKCKRHEWEIIG